MITTAQQCNEIVEEKHIDACIIARQFLRDPNFPFTVAKELNVQLDYWPRQYARAPYNFPQQQPTK
jgi:2,4-dienoyl-CoA reductase-like NADH-dependent reductase (Old Yellow Enzyme family)